MQAQSARQYDSELLNKLALSQLAAEELKSYSTRHAPSNRYVAWVTNGTH